MRRLAIIGASYLQEPLIRKAKEMGYETHVFAWKANDVGELIADHFYPISIIEKDEILEVCRSLDLSGICTIASDLAVITVNYVASKLGLPCNSMETTLRSTNKHLMRDAFARNGDPSPKSILVNSVNDLDNVELSFPVIVKPLDRSGSRGITKVYKKDQLPEAIGSAMEQGFEKSALVEEFAEGDEYSVEYISFKGKHHFLAMTKKYTTGDPHFIETGHLEPAPVNAETLTKVKAVVDHALNTLGITNGASHSEIKIDDDGCIKIIEIGGRMGGDFIGSDLVRISTGIDFVRAVIQVAIGQEPDLSRVCKPMIAGVRFVFDEEDILVYKKITETDPSLLVSSEIREIDGEVSDSSTRFGYYLMASDDMDTMKRYMPREL
ncbi:MAG: ATP-grasp domain-containing protein [Clostridia bacterium]|nr:ATP-grasp domain-containing protein [Clostridia bacterium]